MLCKAVNLLEQNRKLLCLLPKAYHKAHLLQIISLWVAFKEKNLVQNLEVENGVFFGQIASTRKVGNPAVRIG